MSLPIVFVHGSNLGGKAAWPVQAEADFGREAHFLALPGYGEDEERIPTDFDADAAAVVEAAGEGAHVVAHSYGALAAIGAAQLSPATVVSLVLFEPSAFSLVRGEPRVEHFISSFGTEQEIRENERFRLLRPPWEAGLNPDIFADVATLAVTGHSNEVYDVVVDRIASLGGERAEIEGFGHELTNAPQSVDLIRDFVDRVEARISG
jgi:pimeloyl-ACP methyl ester carboxylesterase